MRQFRRWDHTFINIYLIGIFKSRCFLFICHISFTLNSRMHNLLFMHRVICLFYGVWLAERDAYQNAEKVAAGTKGTKELCCAHGI